MNTLPLLLYLYVLLINGRDCWGGFTREAVQNWGPMIRLALPGFLMVEAEYFAFEIMTLAASYISISHLAAQSVLATISSVTWAIPFSIAVASNTRIAHLIGARRPDSAKVAAKVSLGAACAVGLMSAFALAALRSYIPQLFTRDPDVIRLIAAVLPICAAYQIFDALSSICHGILRGIGRQMVGGVVGLLCWYVVGMPVSLGTSFGLRWDLHGLWFGFAVATFLVAAIEMLIIYWTNWTRMVENGVKRNLQG